MKEAVQTGDVGGEEKRAGGLRSTSNSNDRKFNKYMLIAIGAVIILIIIIVVALLIVINSLNKKLTPSKQNNLPAAVTKNILQEQSEQYINTFAKSSIMPTYIPIQVSVLPTTDNAGKVTDPNRYSAAWQLKNGELGTFSIVFSDVSIIDLINISFIVPVRLQDVDAAYAPTVVGNYFTLVPQGQWKCTSVGANNTDTLCENFWIDQNSTKKGIGVLSAKNSSVFYCEIYPTSKNYYRNSCNAYKTQAGRKFSGPRIESGITTTQASGN